jgi:hypothetical protein
MTAGARFQILPSVSVAHGKNGQAAQSKLERQQEHGDGEKRA